MNKELLKKHIAHYQKWIAQNREQHEKDVAERAERIAYYQGWTKERLLKITNEELYEYMAKLWAMLIWGNKQYVVDKLIEDNGLETIRCEFSELLWGDEDIDKRWDRFRKSIKGLGPAMMSELLCHTHPTEYLLWNRRVYVGLNYLEVPNVPKQSYQLTGSKYAELSLVAKDILATMRAEGLDFADLLAVDYFVWQELQVEDNLSSLGRKTAAPNTSKQQEEPLSKEAQDFVHNDIRDKLDDIGNWLGFRGRTEVKVTDGSKVDTIWEAEIGNMGRVVYVFEVQTKGSIDSLILNLLKSLNNPAVQGVVAVSDAKQLQRIKKHAASVSPLNEKLRYWDYEEVLRVHESLELVNDSINSLGLVPDAF